MNDGAMKDTSAFGDNVKEGDVYDAGCVLIHGVLVLLTCADTLSCWRMFLLGQFVKVLGMGWCFCPLGSDDGIV